MLLYSQIAVILLAFVLLELIRVLFCVNAVVVTVTILVKFRNRHLSLLGLATTNCSGLQRTSATLLQTCDALLQNFDSGQQSTLTLQMKVALTAMLLVMTRGLLLQHVNALL